MRVSDTYRLVYRVEPEQRLVTLLMLDHRNAIYGRLGAASDGTPGTRIVAHAAELLEREPTQEEVGNACILEARNPPPPDPAPDRPLPLNLTDELLDQWGVPAEHRPGLVAARTELQLLAMGDSVPSAIVERVMEGLWPRPIEELIQMPVRMPEDASDLERAAGGERDLDQFLLRLDAEQQSFVTRFESPNPQGPWLVKGGPGSGKSTVAIHCARAILDHARVSGGAVPKVLFTTYTKSLVRASRHLMNSLPSRGTRDTVHVQNIDSVARDFLDQAQRQMQIPRQDELQEHCRRAIESARGSQSDFPFGEPDIGFLVDEIDWVIAGQGLVSLEDYLGADRAGRGRPLGPSQRRAVWRVHEEFRRRLRTVRCCLFSDRFAMALERARPEFDYVFVDEAQDLKPIALRFCVKICREPAGVFLAADPNQSIYGSGMSWSAVSTALRFSGKARVLRRNYRTTREIWRAVQQLAPEGESADRETLEAEPVYSGPHPEYLAARDVAHRREQLNRYLFEALRRERLSAGCAAVLCHTNQELQVLQGQIDPRLHPRAMASAEVDLGHPGVKIMTMHAAKGLQFPIVAIVGLEAGRFPTNPGSEATRKEHVDRQRRLLFVACTRAVRRLKLFGSLHRPSEFVAGITEDCWNIEDA